MRFLDSFSMVDHCTWHHWTEWVAICVTIQTPVLQRMKEKPKKNMMIKTLTSITWMIARLINWFTDWFADWSIDWWVSWLVDWLLLWLLLWLLHWQNDRLIDWRITWLSDSLIDKFCGLNWHASMPFVTQIWNAAQGKCAPHLVD